MTEHEASTSDNQALPKYVIINEFDAPAPQMVCQWVPNVGYCYLDRSKARFDGMDGRRATDIGAFGFSWVEYGKGMVRFSQTRPVTATYEDGAPRRWQSPEREFKYSRVTVGVVQVGI